MRRNRSGGAILRVEERREGVGGASSSEASQTRYHLQLRAQEAILSPPGSESEEGRITFDLDMALVSNPDPTPGRRFPIDLALRSGVTELLSAESEGEQETWLSALAAAAVSDTWPGGRGIGKKPQPLLYSMWALQHAGTPSVVMSPAAATAAAAAVASMRGSSSSSSSSSGSSSISGDSSGDADKAAPVAPAVGSNQTLLPAAMERLVPSPFQRLPALKSVPSWQRKGLYLQKLRLCSIVFDGVDGERFLGDREVKRNTLLEILDHVDSVSSMGQGSTDTRLLEDTFTMVRVNVFRPLPTAPAPSAGGDPEEEEEAFSDPQWPHLNIVYELLLKLVSSDHMDHAVKKKVLDPPFVRSLLHLFDSEDARERDFLKTITHRIYSKLTLRRALIRRVICNVFYEFILETGSHHGVGAMLEILASIINGFSVPIKEEHKTTLTRALIPLHKAPSIALYHPQLTYCMALYVSKDHTLTRTVIGGMIKYWPNGAAAKQMMFLNELEDIFEYVQVSGGCTIAGGERLDRRPPLAHRTKIL